MANRAKLRVTGLDELRRAIHLYGEALVRTAVEEVTDATEDTAIKAAFFAPVHDGDLRASYRATVKVDAHGATGTVRSTLAYSHLIEFGSARITKRTPHLVPSAIRNRQRLNARLAQAIQQRAPDGLGRPAVRGDGPSTPTITLT